MNSEEINEFFHRVQNRLVAQIIPTWENLAPMQAQTPVTQQDYNFGRVNSFNSTSHFSQSKNYMLRYHHRGWGTYDNFSNGYLSTQILDSSSSYFQEQVMQLSEELFLALKDEIKKDNEALER